MAASLYSRLGGYDGIAMFATTLVGQAQQDELLSRFWANRGEDRVAREVQLLIDYLVKETGGQMYYTGRDMALSHLGPFPPRHGGSLRRTGHDSSRLWPVLPASLVLVRLKAAK